MPRSPHQDQPLPDEAKSRSEVLAALRSVRSWVMVVGVDSPSLPSVASAGLMSRWRV